MTTQSINFTGLKTLYYKEVWRYMKVWNQTLIAPVITVLLFLAIFNLSVGSHVNTIEGVSFGEFIAAGLIMMAVVQNAFANTSSSLMLSKIQGVIIDLLMPPLSAGEVLTAFLFAGITRGLMVGATVGLAVWLVVPFGIHDPLLALFHLIAASLLLALLGMMTGLWAQGFDQLSAITNYIITPLSFLSGTFYSVKTLPEFWYKAAHFDPFFYMIDGFRYALTGHSDSDPMTGVIVMTVSNIVLWFAAHTLLKSGYRLKS